MLDGPIPEGLTFDDVLLVPNKSAILPTQVDTRTRVTRNITLNIPIVSAAMDTVTESRLAIALAQQGGIGIVHRSMAIEQQALEVDKVKRSESGMIVDPVTIGPRNRIADALEIMKKYKISGVPVTEYGAKSVKKAVVGTGGADKEQVQMMVHRLLPGAVIRRADAADALAVAICHAHHRASKLAWSVAVRHR